MQLGSPARSVSLRGRLSAAACVLLAARAGVAGAAPAASEVKWQFDGSGLIYGEKGRTNVVEPIARITRLFPGGQSLSATLGIDGVTGASPTGAIASTRIQTSTTPSGNVRTEQTGTIPTTTFKDTRASLDLEWARPYGGWLTTTFGGHFSKERDYRSLGGSGKVSLSLMRGLTTLSVGGSANSDEVTPTGGTRVPFSDGTTIAGTGGEAKRSITAVLGISRVLTRRWMVGLDLSRAQERGYLTEPYKVLSLVDAKSGDPVGQTTEKRPSSRRRTSVLASSVYHFEKDILYTSDRAYWDDWGIRSNTTDIRYRHAMENERYIQPHVRYYFQSRANFFRYALVDGAALPEYASADSRLGELRTFTVGGTYGFRFPNSPGEWAVRAEYMRQWGDGHPQEAIGSERNVDLAPPVSIGSVVVAYTVQF